MPLPNDLKFWGSDDQPFSVCDWYQELLILYYMESKKSRNMIYDVRAFSIAEARWQIIVANKHLTKSSSSSFCFLYFTPINDF